MSNLLEGFEAFQRISPITMTVASGAVRFSRGAVRILDRPKFVRVLMGPDGDRLALQQADGVTSDSIHFYDNGQDSVRWAFSYFAKELAENMGWNLTKNSYRVKGEYLPDKQAVLFDLEMATTC
jgi:hypothetical protein